MKVGDDVRIISKREFRTYTPSYGGGVCTPNFLHVVGKMIDNYAGREATITRVMSDEDLYIWKRYRINIDGGCWVWDDWCFQQYEDSEFSDIECLL